MRGEMQSARLADDDIYSIEARPSGRIWCGGRLRGVESVKQIVCRDRILNNGRVLRNAGPARGSAYKKGEWREGVNARWVSGERECIREG
jgi:hypothetical protein